MLHYLVAAVLDLTIGLVAISKSRSSTAIAFFLTCTSIAAWTFELFLLSTMTDLELLSALFHALRIGMFIIPPCIALTTWFMLEKRSTLYFRYVVILGFGVGIALGIANLFIWPSTLSPVPSGFLPEPDLIFTIFAANLVWCLGSAMAYCFWAYGVVTERKKLKIKWLLITLAGTFGASLIATASIHSDFYLAKSIGILPNLVFVGLLAYASIEHNLMDFRTAISVGASKVVSLTFFSAVFLSLLSFFDTQSQLGTTILAAGLFAVFLEIYPKSTLWFKSKTSKLLSANAYDSEELKRTVTSKLNNCNTHHDLKSVLDYVFYHVLKVNTYSLYEVQAGTDDSCVTLHSFENPARNMALNNLDQVLSLMSNPSPITMIDEADEQLRTSIAKNKAISCFPILVEERIAALMFVGKPQGDSALYRFEDFKLLEWLMRELTYALERIQGLAKLQNELGEAKKKLSLLGFMNEYHHDIKAPLSIIDGVVSNDLYDDQKRKEVILQQVAWGSQLIATMAKILKGNRSRKAERINLNDVVSDCCEIFQKTKTAISTDLTNNADITGDSDDLKILLINVLKNAVESARKATPIHIAVSTFKCADRVVLSIEDNGTGIPRELIDDLWHLGHSQKLNGSGIGLQAIKRIADEHSANVYVDSTPEQGSRFRFEFPLPC